MRQAEKAYLLDTIYHPDYGAERLMLGYGERSVGSEVRSGKRREMMAKQLSKLANADGAVTLDTWVPFCLKNRHVATPMFWFQQQLRRTCGGDHDFWGPIADRRRKAFKGLDWLGVEKLLLERHNFGEGGRGRFAPTMHRREEETLLLSQAEMPPKYERGDHQPRLHRVLKAPLPAIDTPGKPEKPEKPSAPPKPSSKHARKPFSAKNRPPGPERARDAKAREKLEATTAYCKRRALFILTDDEKREIARPKTLPKVARTVLDAPKARSSLFT